LDARRNGLVTTIRLEPAPAVGGLRGVLPFGLALSPDESRLYVACAGINAVAVLDTQRDLVLGYIPTGWFPARVAVSRDGGTLYVANAKGFGAGPNGGRDFRMGKEGDYIGDITKGTVSVIPLPADSDLPVLTDRVIRNNGFAPIETVANRREDIPIPPVATSILPIHHVVLIVKENRTFDEVFGDIRNVGGQEVRGDPHKRLLKKVPFPLSLRVCQLPRDLLPMAERVGQSFRGEDGSMNFPKHIFAFTPGASSVGPIRSPRGKGFWPRRSAVPPTSW
jgi:YVTN family beta-propeller protein